VEKSEQNLKRSFQVTYNAATIGVIVCLLSLVLTGVSLKLWKDTGVDWYRDIGLASFGMAFVGIITGFACQSVNLYVQHVARKSGKKPDFFKEYQRPSIFRQIIRRFPAGLRMRPVRTARPRNNVRAYRRAARSTFAFASISPRNSDDPDSGDPPEPTPPAPQSPPVRTPFRQPPPDKTYAQRYIAAHGVCPVEVIRR